MEYNYLTTYKGTKESLLVDRRAVHSALCQALGHDKDHVAQWYELIAEVREMRARLEGLEK